MIISLQGLVVEGGGERKEMEGIVIGMVGNEIAGRGGKPIFGTGSPVGKPPAGRGGMAAGLGRDGTVGCGNIGKPGLGKVGMLGWGILGIKGRFGTVVLGTFGWVV